MLDVCQVDPFLMTPRYKEFTQINWRYATLRGLHLKLNLFKSSITDIGTNAHHLNVIGDRAQIKIWDI